MQKIIFSQLSDTVSADEESLEKVKHVCRMCNLVTKFVFGIACLWWLASVVAMVCLLCDSAFLEFSYTVTPVAILVYILSVAAMFVVCLTLIRIFSDASKGNSPFGMIQVRRLRLISVCLLFYALLGFILSCSTCFVQDGWMSGSMPTLDLFTIIAAAVIYAFSFVFEYGVLLQEFSDDTV